MGNCVFKGFVGDDEVEEMVKVVTSNGGIMELYAPITAGCITNEFPGHGIFFRQEEEEELNLNLSSPLLHSQHLRPGQVYYLLPLDNTGSGCGITLSSYGSAAAGLSNRRRTTTCNSTKSRSTKRTPQKQQQDDHHHYCYSDTNSMNSCRRGSRANRTPYRMSFDNHQGMLWQRYTEAAAGSGGRGGDPAVLPRYNSSGVWKVRLVINPEQLSEILSQESRTEALIESVRAVAKCGGNNNTTVSATSSWVSSMTADNQRSVSSSWRTEH